MHKDGQTEPVPIFPDSAIVEWGIIIASLFGGKGLDVPSFYVLALPIYM